jgi:Restriction endonuclease
MQLLSHGAHHVSQSDNFNTHYIHWMGPVLEALRELGGSASPREVSAWIARKLNLTHEFTESTVKSGANRFRTQVAFARQYLVWEGFLDDGTRGLWKLTPLGWKTELSIEQARVLTRERNLVLKATGQPKVEPNPPALPLEEDSLPPEEVQELDLLGILKALPPYGFELICGRLLREHGFEEVEVTQRSRDGGIDGYGLLRLSPFVSLRVAFQAKRYKDVVTRSAVGEFRNALLGRAEKGVFITTGRFTTDAESEATRDGVVPVELIDGERLVELFQDAGIGVKPKTIYEIDHAFFDEFRRTQ